MLTDLKDKAVLVTGASTGIGAAVAKGFAAQGARVAVHYKSSEAAAKAVVDAIVKAGGEAILVQGDLGKPGEGRAHRGRGGRRARAARHPRQQCRLADPANAFSRHRHGALRHGDELSM